MPFGLGGIYVFRKLMMACAVAGIALLCFSWVVFLALVVSDAVSAVF